MAEEMNTNDSNDWYSYVEKYMLSEGLKINDNWIKLVTHFEGLRLRSYQDSVGVWTIGYGHTRTAGPKQIITKEKAIQLLHQDVERFENAVNDLVEVPLTQYQFNALVTFSFNLGEGNLESSTLLSLLNQEDYEGASDEFIKWVYAGGKKLDGLVRRRKAEQAMFRGENWEEYIS